MASHKYVFDLTPWLHLPEETNLQLRWGFVPEHQFPRVIHATLNMHNGNAWSILRMKAKELHGYQCGNIARLPKMILLDLSFRKPIQSKQLGCPRFGMVPYIHA